MQKIPMRDRLLSTIAALSLLGILAHLALRYGMSSPFADAPLLIVLGTGGGFLLLLAALLSLCGSGWLALKEWPRAAPLDAVREAGQRKPSS